MRSVTAHARLSPSACSRWSTCTASVALIDDLVGRGVIPAETTSIYAAEGTVAHEVRETCLTFGLEPYHFVGSVMSADGFTFTVDDDMARHLQIGIDWVREHTGSPAVEIRVDLSPWLPDQFGTCDTGWVEMIEAFPGDGVDARALVISDLKYGMGEPVDAVGNKQMRLYALGLWHFLGRPEVDVVLMNIDQPRAGGMKFWEIPFSELLEFGEEMKAVYAKIVSGDVEFAPSDSACRWCPVKDAPGGCGARNKWLLEMVVDDFETIRDDDPRLRDGLLITPELRWHIVRHAPTIRAWLAKLHEDSLAAALNGKPDPGSKAVAGDLGDRYFPDKAKAEKILVSAIGDKAYQPRELIGVGEIEKYVKPGRKKAGHPDAWEQLQELFDRKPGKPKLVPEHHAAPALVRWDDVFEDL